MARSAEKLFECPLCGVAERKRRCSKSGVSSRILLVKSESTAQEDEVAGAAWCASSSTSMEPVLCWLSQSRRGEAYCSSRRREWETMNCEWVVQGLIAYPRSRQIGRASC